jgi:glyceraldehyde 3-phosphate dehydrogenase
LTATGASSAVKKVLPDLEAKISGNSIRVPTPDVSMAILSLQLQRESTQVEVLTYLRQTSLEGPLSRCLDYTTATDAVSSDFVGSRASSVIDANATLVDGDQAQLYVWYDNEFGYSCQVVRVVQSISGVEFPTYPVNSP